MDAVTRIEHHSFGRTDVSFSTLPPAVTEVGASAFQGCLLLTNFTFPSSVTVIGTQAFSGCISFNTTALPSGLTEIADYAFDSCDLHSLSALPSGVTRIGADAFANTKVPLTSLPSSLIEIGDTAFYHVTTLNIQVLPDTLCKIGPAAFAHSRGGDPEDPSLGLTALLPKGLTHIGRDAFVGTHITKAILWDALEECISPLQQINTLTEVFVVQNANGFNELDGKFAYGCNALSEVNLPSNITSIGDMAFFRENNTPIPIFRLRATTPPALGITPFVTGQVVQVPSSALESYQADEAWAALIDAGTITLAAIDNTTVTHYYGHWNRTGAMTSFNGWSSLSRFNSEVEGELRIGPGVTYISTNYFAGTLFTRIDCSEATSLKTFNAIGPWNHVEEIVMPPNLTTLSADSISSLSSVLKRVYFTDTTLKTIGNRAFLCVANLELLDFGNTRTSVPTMGNSGNTSLPSGCKVVVPDALVDEWKATANWTYHASKIVAYSQYYANT